MDHATATTAQTPNPFLLLADMKLTDLPRIGQEWPGQGGVFAGLVRSGDGAPDYVLILGPEYDGELDWQASMDWAAGLEIDGHKGFVLPTQDELSILYGNVGKQFSRGGYWSSTQHDGYASCAWKQPFCNDYQFREPKGSEWRGRAIRRLIIQ